MALPTQQELLDLHRKALEAKFQAKYPNGKFCLQFFDGLHIHWCNRRPTSHTRPRGISVELRRGIVEHKDYQNNSFGKCNDYDTLEKLLRACAKGDVPTELVEAFKKRYYNRRTEGFK